MQIDGKVNVTKDTQGVFYINIEDKNGNSICEARLTAEQFAHAVTGKYVDAKLEIPST